MLHQTFPHRPVHLALLLIAMAGVNRGPIRAFDDTAPEAGAKMGGIVTLYKLDPVARTFCFGDGLYGQTLQDRGVYNRASDIDYGNFKSRCFSIAIEGGRRGKFIDLGSAVDIVKTQGFVEGEGLSLANAFASIHKKGGTVLIGTAKQDVYQAIKQNDELFAEGERTVSGAVKLGHIYVLRLTHRGDPQFERVVKMLVISYRENESVTIRWELLE